LLTDRETHKLTNARYNINYWWSCIH